LGAANGNSQSQLGRRHRAEHLRDNRIHGGGASEWLEYLTTAQPTTLAKERDANAHPAPYEVAFLGIGNESWDCGGNMTPDYYII
jgi:alpha-L-arabinofuranosidase